MPMVCMVPRKLGELELEELEGAGCAPVPSAE
jgi:hypothetical protein